MRANDSILASYNATTAGCASPSSRRPPRGSGSIDLILGHRIWPKSLSDTVEAARR
jgi:hypothetical protein